MLAVALLSLAVWCGGTLYPPSDVSHCIFRVAVCLAVAQGVGLPKGRLVRWGLGMWAAGIVWSMIAAPDPWRALWSTHNRNEGAWQVSHYIGLMLVACATPREKLARWVAVAALAAAAWGAWPAVGWVNGWLAGSTGNPLYLAPLLLIGVWGAWRAGDRRKRDNVAAVGPGAHGLVEAPPFDSAGRRLTGRCLSSLGLWRALAVILALAALATGSKGVVVAAVAAGGVLALAKAPRLALGLAVGLAAALWFVPIPDSGLIRIELGRVALRGIWDSPLGWGAEGYPFVWDTFWRGVSATGEAWHDRAHSLMLDRAIEWGIVGLAGWVAVVVAAWRRAELPERMAIAAYLGYGLTMFEMMWGAAGFAVLLGYCMSHGETARLSLGCQMRYVWRKRSSSPFLAAALLALVVGSLALSQSSAASRAADFPAMQRAIEMPSPVGGDIIELYLKAKQTPESLDWAADWVEVWSPHAAQQLFLLAVWDRRYCAELLAVAPRRPDVLMLCDEELGLALGSPLPRR